MSWEIVKLGEVCDVIGGYAFKSENYKNIGIPLLRISNIVDGEVSFKSDCLCVDDSNLSSLQRFKVLKGDILLALSGATTGKFGVYNLDEVAFLNQRVGLIRATERTDQKYLLYYLNILKSQIEQMAQGAAQPNISTNEISNLQIPLPPLPNQKRIAEILDAADALKRKDQALLKKYDELAQAIFIDMFGDPVKNEKGWVVKRIGDITTVGSGGTPSRQEPSYFEGEIPWVKTTEVNGEIINSTEENITQDGLKNSSCKIYPKDSVLIAMYGQGKTRGQVGILGVEATTNQACAVISPCKSLNPIFLFNYLKLSYNELRSLGRGGNQENLNKGMIEDFLVIIPPMNTQIKFNNLIDNIRLQQLKSDEKKSSTLFHTLIQKAFKGELVN